MKNWMMVFFVFFFGCAAPKKALYEEPFGTEDPRALALFALGGKIGKMSDGSGVGCGSNAEQALEQAKSFLSPQRYEDGAIKPSQEGPVFCARVWASGGPSPGPKDPATIVYQSVFGR